MVRSAGEVRSEIFVKVRAFPPPVTGSWRELPPLPLRLKAVLPSLSYQPSVWLFTLTRAVEPCRIRVGVRRILTFDQSLNFNFNCAVSGSSVTLLTLDVTMLFRWILPLTVFIQGTKINNLVLHSFLFIRMNWNRIWYLLISRDEPDSSFYMQGSSFHVLYYANRREIRYVLYCKIEDEVERATRWGLIINKDNIYILVIAIYTNNDCLWPYNFSYSVHFFDSNDKAELSLCRPHV